MGDGRWSTWIRRMVGEPVPSREPQPSAEPDPVSAPAAPRSSEEALQDLREWVDKWSPQARFLCAVHGTEAAKVKLIRRYTEDSELVIESALGRGWHRLKTPADEATFGDPVAEELQDVLDRADVIGLHLMNPKWTPFFCTACARVYCGACWVLEDVPHPDYPDSPALRATCPEGHSSMLFD